MQPSAPLVQESRQSLFGGKSHNSCSRPCRSASPTSRLLSLLMHGLQRT
jgi:hypothetical protein